MTKQQQIDDLKSELDLYKTACTKSEDENIKLLEKLVFLSETLEETKLKLADQKLALANLCKAIALMGEAMRRSL